MKKTKPTQRLPFGFVITSVVASVFMLAFSVLVPTTGAQAALQIVPPDCTDEDGCTICETVKVFTNAADLIGAILSALALLMFIVGGFFLIFSGGQPDKIEKGKKVLLGTITGLAIVFLAWFTINVIVRVAASSGKTSQDGLGTDTTLFAKSDPFSWWDLSGCQPATPKTCKGQSIGTICGFGECGASATACSCYRSVDPDGDDNLCTGDDVTDATSATYKDKKCSCSSQCTRVAQRTSKNYHCVAEKTYTAHPENYNLATGISCVDSGQVCLVEN